MGTLEALKLPLIDPLIADDWGSGLDTRVISGNVYEWIPKSAPPSDQRIVLVKTDKGAISTAYWHGDSSGFIAYGEHAYIKFGVITHWMDVKL